MLDVAALKAHIATYPKLQPQDIIKFLYQGEFGCGHLIPDYSDAYERFCAEWDSVQPMGEIVFEPLNHDFCRINLGAAKASGMSASLVLRMFFSSATVCGNKADLATQLDYVLSLAENGEIDINPADFQKEISEYKGINMPIVSHTAQYALAYSPSYRVLKSEYAQFALLFIKLYDLLHEKPDFTLVIDGMAASGKTTLANLIASIIPCNIVPADCFFLPSALRTKQRLAQIGGNIDYQRIRQEITEKLPCSEDIYYGVFNCKKMDIIGEGRIIAGLPIIFEGAYSCHPKAEIKADITVMLKTTLQKQLTRILARNGKLMCQKYENIWIPMENSYLHEFKIESNADLIYET